jgi:hypothetical protein
VEYAQFLQQNPHTELDSVLEATGPDVGWYPAGAVLVEMVHDRGGWSAVRQLLTSGRSNDELREAPTELLDVIAQRWKEKISAAVR